ncbi:MAG TPA: AMP-binding protein, partial [Nocardioidaceae bacterium]|nr:AMP-binding protein [Nocardioidaceae bacterium]
MYGHKTIVTATPRGDVETTYREWAIRVRKLAGVLDDLGISDGGRVGTYAANNQSHLEVYLAAPCTGRVAHTVNIRLSADDVHYIIDHAGDEVVFVDRSRLAELWPTARRLSGVRHWVVL